MDDHWYQIMVPTTWIYSIQFEFWSPQQHQHLCLHSTCHLNNKTYPLTTISTLVCPVPVTEFTQPLHTNDFITLYMLLFIPLHFQCTHFLQLVHYWIITNDSTTDTTWPSYSLLCYLLPLPLIITLDFIHIYSHASILHIILPLIKPFNQILFSLSYHNQIICIQQQLPW